MASSVQIGSSKLDVIQDDVLRFTTNRVYPIVLHTGVYTGSSSGGYTSFTTRTHNAVGYVISSRIDVFQYQLATKNVDYSATPDFVLGNLQYRDYRGTLKTVLCGSHVVFSPPALVMGDGEFVTYYNFCNTAVSGLGPSVSLDLYINGSGHTILETRFTRPALVLGPPDPYSDYRNAFTAPEEVVYQFSLSEYYNSGKWDFHSFTDEGTPSSLSTYRYYYWIDRLDYVVGAFIGD